MNLEDFYDKPKAKSGFVRPVASSDKGNPLGVNLVDYSQIVLSTIMGTFKPDDVLSIDLIRHCVLSTLKANVMKNRKYYPQVILCMDNSDGRYWRKNVASYYKASRKKARDKLEYNFELIFAAMAEIKNELIENFPYIVMDIPGMEADDHIGILTRYFQSKSVKVLITSSDGDFAQLHDYKLLKQWSPIQKKWVKPKHGSAKNDLLVKCFKGDKKDGIANYRAVSDHYARDDVGRVPSITESLLQSLLKASENELQLMLTEVEYARYEENRKLLDFALIPKEYSDAIIKHYNDYMIAPRSKIYPFFIKKGLSKLMPDVSEF